MRVHRLALTGSIATAIGAACGVLSVALVVMVRSCAASFAVPVVHATVATAHAEAVAAIAARYAASHARRTA